MTVDEVLINGRRYRVPERIVVLDFWNKVSMKANVEKCVSLSLSLFRSQHPHVQGGRTARVRNELPPHLLELIGRFG